MHRNELGKWFCQAVHSALDFLGHTKSWERFAYDFLCHTYAVFAGLSSETFQLLTLKTQNLVTYFNDETKSRWLIYTTLYDVMDCIMFCNRSPGDFFIADVSLQ